MSEKMPQKNTKKRAQGLQNGSQNPSKMVPKRGNKGGNKEHNSQVAPRVPQEPQNEPKLVPQVSNLRLKRCRKPSKIQTKGVTSCSYPSLCLALARSPKFSQMPHRCCPNSHFSAFTCFDSVGNFPACFFSGWSKRSEAERGSSYLSAFTCFDSVGSFPACFFRWGRAKRRGARPFLLKCFYLF